MESSQIAYLMLGIESIGLGEVFKTLSIRRSKYFFFSQRHTRKIVTIRVYSDENGLKQKMRWFLKKFYWRFQTLLEGLWQLFRTYCPWQKVLEVKFETSQKKVFLKMTFFGHFSEIFFSRCWISQHVWIFFRGYYSGQEIHISLVTNIFMNTYPNRLVIGLMDFTDPFEDVLDICCTQKVPKKI